jgi:hypothetical protein
MKNEITNFIKESVEWLVAEQQGCATYKIDDHLAICVGWSAGYGKEARNDVIQAKDNPDYGINVGVKVWTSDTSMLTDYEWIQFPYYNDGEVLDMEMSIIPNENYDHIADVLLKWYDEVENLVLADDGRILEDDRYDYNR